jgi:hypothetical protein
MRAYLFVLRLSSIAGRAVAFFFLCSLLLFFLYLLGNSQDFLDDTQLLLLGALRVTLILELVSGVYLALLLVVRTVRERRVFLLRSVLLALSMAVSIVLLLGIRFLQSWLRG